MMPTSVSSLPAAASGLAIVATHQTRRRPLLSSLAGLLGTGVTPSQERELAPSEGRR